MRKKDEDPTMGMCLTIQLNQDLQNRLRRLVPPPGLNRFIGQAIEDKVRELERGQLELLKEGYIAGREDREKLNADWQVIDCEKWPD